MSTASDLSTSYLSPPAIARRFGVAPDKVLRWIKSGELGAVDVSTRRGGRPRWMVSPDALAAFESARSATPPSKPQRRQQRQRRGDVIEYI